MKRVLIAAALAGRLANAQSGCQTSPEIRLTGNACGRVQALYLSCLLPSDIASSVNQNTVQRSADIFSWQEFLSLNWPVQPGQRGKPDGARPISAPGPRVWETWKESYEVFKPDGSVPGPWNAPERTTAGAGKVLTRTQKIDDKGIDSKLQAAASQLDPPPTLTDQKGRLVRYEIRMNQVMFDYIVKNKLYNGIDQAKFGPVDLPNGSMLIKAAWREVHDGEDFSRYYAANALVCDGDFEHGPPKNCRHMRMALVGLHITQRTPNAPQWIWTTFEHLDNVPGPRAAAPFGFFNPACPTCPLNQQTKPPYAAQLTRLLAIPEADPDCGAPEQALDNARHLNGEVSDALAQAKSIFANYQLLGTQRPLPPAGVRPITEFTATPVMLGNTTMESYVQKSSSCIGCHSTARTSNPNAFVSAHFTFMLNNAKPVPADTTVLTLPTIADPKVARGKAIADQTYELLPANAKAKLHCSSCHLNGGANSTAAWWVDLAYRYPKQAQLENRINQCFRNSMNGTALCTPGNCDGNADMRSIVAYMAFLDGVYKAAKWPAPTPHGFPPVKILQGGKKAGEATFAQKCAVCHGLNGEGRYGGGKYFRPALWGPDSFNDCAGMFASPSMLAQFLSWNMPLGAGGLLTDQESWDLEAFIHGHARPKSTCQ